MKKILALTDFSACAENGVDTAIRLAENSGAELIVYSRVKIPFNWQTLTNAEKAQNPEAVALVSNTEALFDALKDRYADKKVKIKTLFSGGKLIEMVRDLVESENIDLLVLGSHGSSGLEELFVGSNTQRIVRFVHCPVLVVKNKRETIEFKNIVYASDFNASDKAAFLRFLIFVRNFDPTIHLLSVNTLGFFSQPYVLTKTLMDEYKAICGDDINCEIHMISNPFIEPGIREFANDIDADLIVVSNEHRHPIKRMFTGSNVEALINHSDVPVLSLDFKD
ncbi:MAG: universal stress protein [Bacteroidota bacterium]